jgi:hypothetical protein
MRTCIVAVSDRLTGDEALDCGYLRWKGFDGVPGALSLLRGGLGLELQ